MSILVNKESKILCQGITGSQGSFHAEQCIEYGSNIVAGVTPGKGGTTHLDVPVFNSVAEATTETEIDVSMIFVPAKFAADAMKSAIKSEIELIVCITEAVKSTAIDIPIVVRLQGTNVDLGKKILEESGMKIISASDLTDAAIRVVSSVKG